MRHPALFSLRGAMFEAPRVKVGRRDIASVASPAALRFRLQLAATRLLRFRCVGTRCFCIWGKEECVLPCGNAWPCRTIGTPGSRGP